MFQEVMNDIATSVNANGEYSLEFAIDAIDEVFLLVFVRYWRGDELCRVFVKRAGRLQGQSDAEICLISSIMGAISTKPKLISCHNARSGSSARTVQLLDHSPYSSFSVQSPPRFEELTLSQLMHRKVRAFLDELISSLHCAI